MTVIRNIKMTIDECIQCLEDICKQHNWGYEVQMKQRNIQFVAIRNDERALLRLYDTNTNGRSVDPSAGSNGSFNEDLCDLFLQASVLRLLQSAWASYRVSSDEKQKFIQDLNEFAASTGCTINQIAGAGYIEYRGKYYSNDRPGEAITITLHTTGTFQIQGKSYIVWDQLCEWVEKRLNASESDMIIRFCGKESQAANIRGVITTNTKDDAETVAREALGLAFDFLHEMDQKYAISTYCQVISGIEYPDNEYSTYVMPICKTLEGYIKDVLVKLGVCREREFDVNWTFGSVFAGNNFDQKVKPHLNGTPQEVSMKETALKELYDLIPDRRHVIMHSSPRKKKEIDKRTALAWIDEISGAISSKHLVLFP